MLYMATQIVFFLILAALVGVAIGWGLASAGKPSVFKALSRSGADAPRERELSSAKAQIAELSRQLSIAKEAIREIETKDAMAAAAAAVVAEDDDVEDDVTEYDDVEYDDAEYHEEVETFAEDAYDVEANGQGELFDDAESFDEDMDEEDEEAVTASPHRMSRDRGGRRLSERVADATVGNGEPLD